MILENIIQLVSGNGVNFGVLPAVLMGTWLYKDTKKTRWNLYISQIITLISAIIVAIICVVVVVPLGLLFCMKEDGSLNMPALILGGILFVALFTLGIAFPCHYVTVSKKLYQNIQEWSIWWKMDKIEG